MSFRRVDELWGRGARSRCPEQTKWKTAAQILRGAVLVILLANLAPMTLLVIRLH